MKSPAATFIILGGSLFIGAAAYCNCIPGQMTKLLTPAHVTYYSGLQKLTITLPGGTEVHIVDVDSKTIDFYAMKDGKGQIISGLGNVPLNNTRRLQCQRNQN